MASRDSEGKWHTYPENGNWVRVRFSVSVRVRFSVRIGVRLRVRCVFVRRLGLG